MASTTERIRGKNGITKGGEGASTATFFEAQVLLCPAFSIKRTFEAALLSRNIQLLSADNLVCFTLAFLARTKTKNKDETSVTECAEDERGGDEGRRQGVNTHNMHW